MKEAGHTLHNELECYPGNHMPPGQHHRELTAPPETLGPPEQLRAMDSNFFPVNIMPL